MMKRKTRTRRPTRAELKLAEMRNASWRYTQLSIEIGKLGPYRREWETALSRRRLVMFGAFNRVIAALRKGRVPARREFERADILCGVYMLTAIAALAGQDGTGEVGRKVAELLEMPLNKIYLAALGDGR